MRFLPKSTVLTCAERKRGKSSSDIPSTNSVLKRLLCITIIKILKLIFTCKGFANNMIKVEYFTFNPLAENTYVLSNEKGDALIIDPGCYFTEEEKILKNYIDEIGRASCRE